MKTKAIQLLINSILPEDIRDYTRTYDKKSINELMSTIADKHPDKYSDIIKKLTDIGGQVSYLSGETLTLDDFKPMFDKDAIIDRMQEEAKVIKKTVKNRQERKDKLDNLYAKYAVALEDLTMQAGKERHNNLFNIVSSGARGNSTQLKMLITAPSIYTDNNGNIIPLFIRNSYGEGLTLPEYLASTFGARSAVAANKRATAKSGGLGKELARTSAPLVINRLKDDLSYPGMGVDLDPNSDDAYGRVLAKDAMGMKAGTVLDRNALAYLRKHNVKRVIVHSPIATISEEGLPSESFGLDYNRKLPPIGFSAGVTAAQTLEEPLAQNALNSKHSSGAFKGQKDISGLSYIEQFLQSPETFADKATVATIDGKVKKIEDAPQGGKYIYIGDEKHYVLPDTIIDVKVGDDVEAGDIMSDGLADPEDIVRYKGLGEGRRYYANRLKKLMDDSGIKTDLRNTEVLARMALNTVRITDPDGYGEYLPEDIVSYNKLEANYVPRETTIKASIKKDKNNILGKYLERPILHYSIGTKISNSMLNKLKDLDMDEIYVNDEPPGFEPVVTRIREASMKGNEDWLARMQGSYLKQNILDAAAKGLDTNVKENINPYARMGVAYDFGDNINKGKF